MGESHKIVKAYGCRTFLLVFQLLVLIGFVNADTYTINSSSNKTLHITWEYDSIPRESEDGHAIFCIADGEPPPTSLVWTVDAYKEEFKGNDNIIVDTTNNTAIISISFVNIDFSIVQGYKCTGYNGSKVISIAYFDVHVHRSNSTNIWIGALAFLIVILVAAVVISSRLRMTKYFVVMMDNLR